jgi:hypothetical protein
MLGLQLVPSIINSLDEIVDAIRLPASIAVLGSTPLEYYYGLAYGRAVVM